jgi:peroxiredoxin
MMSNGAQRPALISPPAKELLVTRCIVRMALFAMLLLLQHPASAGATTVGDQAPDFALPASVGGNVRLSEHRGEVVLLTFWSSRCAICATQLAQLGDLQTTYRSAGLVTLAVSVDDDLRRATQFARSHPARFPLLLDRRKDVSRAYGIERLPTTVLIDRRGRVRFLQSDYRGTDNSYVAQVRELLDDPL